MKINRTATVIALAIAAIVALSAFQGPQPKFGAVDMGKVAEDSKLGKRKRTEFDNRRNKISALLQFMQEKRVMTRDQATKLRELMLVENPTQDQQNQLKTLQDAINQTKAEFDGLMRLPQPNDAQLRRVNELSALASEALEIAKDWSQEFGQEMSRMAQDTQTEVLDKVRAAVQKVGKRDGYTIVFESATAIYSANDISQDVLKVMDTDNP